MWEVVVLKLLLLCILGLAVAGPVGVAMAQAPAPEPPWRVAVQSALNAGDLDRAETLCREALQDGPEDPDRLLALGDILLLRGRPAEAEPPLRKALELRPDDADGLNDLGLCRIRRGDPASGLALLHRAVEVHPDYEPAHFNLGELLYRGGLPDTAPADAVPYLRRAVELNPARVQAHRYLAEHHAARHEVQASAVHYQAVLDQAGHSAEVYAQLGLLYLENGLFDAALVEFDNALRLDPEFAEAHWGAGVTLLYRGDRDLAERALRAALEFQPDHVRALTDLGLAVQALGTGDALAEAESLYRQALTLDEGYHRARYNLAVLLERTDRADDAARAYGHVLDGDPGHRNAALNLGALHQEAGRLDAAIAVYEAGLRASPEDVPLRFNLALALLDAGRDTDRALDTLGEIALTAKDGDAWGLRAYGVLQDLKAKLGLEASGTRPEQQDAEQEPEQDDRDDRDGQGD